MTRHGEQGFHQAWQQPEALSGMDRDDCARVRIHGLAGLDCGPSGQLDSARADLGRLDVAIAMAKGSSWPRWSPFGGGN